jgi:superfamily II DNA or RNA helicase
MERAEVARRMSALEPPKNPGCTIPTGFAAVSAESPKAHKIALFRRLFKGRLDVFPRRFESAVSGKVGYAPACRHDFVKGICGKPKIKCGLCTNQAFIPVDDAAVLAHLTGAETGKAKKTKQQDFTIGVYPLLPDETCWFVAADFDKADWLLNVTAYRDSARDLGLPVAIERSRSGNGAHAWIFFEQAVPAADARRLGTLLLTAAMDRRPDLSFKAYDRLFPSQDLMPLGGFGNLIALPLQHKPRERGNSVFVDDAFAPYADQWAYLDSIDLVSLTQLTRIASEAVVADRGLGVPLPVTEEDEPWAIPPSRRRAPPPITGPLPEYVDVVRANQVFVDRTNLPPALVTRILRVASYQNPEFYRAQAMRFATYDKPRVVSCAELLPKYVAVPRGCFQEIKDLLGSLKIEARVRDERNLGTPLNVKFLGALHPEQEPAFRAIKAHDLGVLAVAPSFGKTVLGAKMIAERGVNTLIIVHSKAILDQWLTRLPIFLDIAPKDLGVMRGGKKKPAGIIDVALWQSLIRDNVVDDSVANYGQLIVDECHHVAAKKFELIAKEVKARYILGLSATPVRKDGHHPIIFMHCGPVRYRVSPKELAASRPFEHTIIIRHTQFKPIIREEVNARISIQDLYGALARDAARNDLIFDDVVAALEAGRSPLVITERKDHLEMLAERLSKFCKNMIVLKGGMSRRGSKAAIAAIEACGEDDERLLLATGRYLGEGFDDARLDTLFLTLPISWRGTLSQYAGRLSRLYAGKKEVTIYDYVDAQEPMLARMAAKRAVGYRSLGYRESSNETLQVKAAQQSLDLRRPEKQ